MRNKINNPDYNNFKTNPMVSFRVSTLLSLFSYGRVGMCWRRLSKASLMLCILLLSLMLAACLTST